jgi:hypothetical protein
MVLPSFEQFQFTEGVVWGSRRYQNTKSEIAIYYLFSNNHINELISYRYDFRSVLQAQMQNSPHPNALRVYRLLSAFGAR